MFLLKGSKLRNKLLSYSFTHISENYYVRELSVILDEDPGNLSRELKKLEGEGLYVSVSRGGAKFYSLNEKYPFLPQLKDIVSKTYGIEGSLKELISDFKEIKTAFIYGSYAKNTENALSDVDLILVGKYSEDKFTAKLRKLESILSREINFTSYTEEEYEKERKKEGGFLKLVLKGKVIILKGRISD